MINIATIVGARPQFVKASVVSRAIARHNREQAIPIHETIIHTGQHYDDNMSQVFFDDLMIPEPAVNLSVGSGRHGEMTGQMLIAIEAELLRRKPDFLLLYGDTNSTLAGALAASKIPLPILHVEAGLRSYQRWIPEEVNRLVTDHLSSVLFCPTLRSVKNLELEHITEGVHHVGDVMYDAALIFAEIAGRTRGVERFGLEPKNYYLATVHRPHHTDVPERMLAILEGLRGVATAGCPVAFPVHPRTQAKLREMGILNGPITAVTGVQNDRYPNVRFMPPAGFLDMVCLERSAKAIITDSGGVQKEAYFHRVPCITLRKQTEWQETADAGWNQLAGDETHEIIEAVAKAAPGKEITEYGAGHAAEEIVKIISTLPTDGSLIHRN